jgi:CRP-like cAMP-binding protein
MLGLPTLLGMNIAVMTAFVQGSGSAMRIGADVFLREIQRLPELRHQLHRYVFVILAQLALTSSCARFHALDARLARSLLMTHDRANFGSFHLTHKFLGQMLGVRRVGVTEAAGRLQKRKIVS